MTYIKTKFGLKSRRISANSFQPFASIVAALTRHPRSQLLCVLLCPLPFALCTMHYALPALP